MPIAKPLHNVTFRYANRLNKKFSTVGHQFQCRYKAYLANTAEYKLNLLKYIHRNPVEAKMVNFCHEYQYSSHNYYSNRVQLDWTERNDLLSLFSDDLNDAISLAFHFPVFQAA